ncbi:MAG: transposase [Verrucomicrobiota bacterium]|nr:transposase [Verrucomicrobiota bacterium]
MTDIISITRLAVLKTDSRGRVQTPAEQREALMDAFEKSSMSGAAFTRLHGIRYSTFAHWRRVRKCRDVPQPDYDRMPPFFEKVTFPGSGSTEVGLHLALPGGASLTLDRADQFPLAAALLKYLEHVC